MLILVKELIQLTNHTFRIIWSDFKWSEFHLNELQKNCPCARCQNKPAEEKMDLRAIKISSVGNYALRIDFTQGCSRGVFTFQFLRTLHLKEDL